MGSFSIWHWLFVMFFFGPVILLTIGIAIFGIQKSVLIKHTPSGLVKKGAYGWSWTYQIFGWLVPIFRGELGIGILHLFFTVITFGFFNLVMPFLYNKQYMTRMLTTGWELADTEERNQAARIKLGIAAEKGTAVGPQKSSVDVGPISERAQITRAPSERTVQTPQQASTGKFCSECGAAIVDVGSAFCAQCGNKL